MAEDSSRPSIAHRVERILGCPPHLIADLSADQMTALHSFKHKLVASLHQLYKTVPEEQADKILSRALKQIIDELP
jgi:hypothetical protein